MLHQIFRFVPAHLSNTEDFLSRLGQVFPYGLPAESTLFTMDVTALYSNIPIEEGIQTALRLAEAHWDDIDTIGFELSELEDLLRFVLMNSFFRFGEDIWVWQWVTGWPLLLPYCLCTIWRAGSLPPIANPLPFG